MADVAILGATGPTGIHLANILRRQNMAVRVVSRGAANLQRAFGAPVFEKVAADVLDADAAIRAVDGCRLVYDCLGLPADQMHLHLAAARNIAKAVGATGARCIQVSSYWAYLPLQRSPLNEAHPRSGGPDWVRWRRDAEVSCAMPVRPFCICRIFMGPTSTPARYRIRWPKPPARP